MSKKQINEKQLLAGAKAWFEQKYEKSPKDCGVKFIKIWRKPTPFKKTIAVVFAPTEEIGKAFIWEQNVIFRTLKNSWIIVLFCFITAGIFLSLLQCNSTPFQVTMGMLCIGTPLLAGLFCLYMARKCKKLEKIHQWNVEVYYPQQ